VVGTLNRRAEPTGSTDLSPRACLLAVAAATLFGAALRFATLSVQSLEGDELFTAWLVRMPLDGLVSTVPDSESTPHLYYLLNWLWTHAFGSGRFGLRSLSALVGTATIPAAAWAARGLFTRRASAVAAVLVATSPALLYYSQEARANALATLALAVGLGFFFRALAGGDTRSLVGWAAASSVALVTHYFAAFMVLPEAVLLLWRHETRRLAWRAAAAPTLTGMALLALVVHQVGTGNPDAPGQLALGTRVAQIPKVFLIGFSIPHELAFTVAAALLAAVAALGFLPARERTSRHAATLPATVALAALGVPALLSLVGLDYTIIRNVVAALVPCLLVAAIGFSLRATGLVAAAALAAVWTAAFLATAVDARYQRLDFDGAASALGPARAPRALVFDAFTRRDGPVGVDYPRVRHFSSGTVRVGEIDDLALATEDRFGVAGAPRPPRPPTPPAPAGFRVAERRNAETFTLIRYRARRPRAVSAAELYALSLQKKRPKLFLQRP
jgi:4-amino-4-deoxy-L-arabinose transferase-like glycosyltransferase